MEPDSISSVVSIDSDGIEILAYPNPVIEKLYIQHNAQEKLNYEIIDVSGNRIHAFSGGISDETFILDVSGYASGAYYLMCRDAQNRMRGNEMIFKK